MGDSQHEDILRAMNRCRAGRTLSFDLPNGEIAIEADCDDVYYSYYCTREDGSTKAIDGIQVWKLVSNHEFKIE